MNQKIAFITYETPYAPCGGIAAVVKRLPVYLKNASQIDTIVITPFHHRIEKTNSLKTKKIGNVNVVYKGTEINVDILKYSENVDWYFLKASDEHFFAGYPNPYIIDKVQGEFSGETEKISDVLLRDSLFFGSAVSRSLSVIEKDADWILLMQDWETATTVLPLADMQEIKTKNFITLHNSYDSSAVSDEMLMEFSMNPGKCRGPEGKFNATVLERVLLIVEKNVFTVSQQFAFDLAEDVFQSKTMAPHLQNLLNPWGEKTRLVGIDNGPFAKLEVPKNFFLEADKKNYIPLADWKKERRADALKLFKIFVPDKEKKIWGNLSKFNSKDSPWFVFAGRDDTRQKGYDVAVYAISEFLKTRNDAVFLFFPMPGDEGLEGLNFLKELAEQNSKNVLVFPFQWIEGYMAALQGAAFGVMPSLYEPFGMANEFYLNGTVGIGRATGGLLQQIVPLKSVSSFSKSVQIRTARMNLFSAPATGLLYREKDYEENYINSIVEDWQKVNEAKYDKSKNGNNRVNERAKLYLFKEMAKELKLCITDAVFIYHENQELYYQMLINGINHINCSFSWGKTAQEYIREVL
jgi:glycogen synthase